MDVDFECSISLTTLKAMFFWAQEQGVKLAFIQPGQPTQNAFVESLNGKFRNECLNQHWFRSIEEAREKIEAWRRDYNGLRPHSSLNNLTPDEFSDYHQRGSLKNPQRQISTKSLVQKMGQG